MSRFAAVYQDGEEEANFVWFFFALWKFFFFAFFPDFFSLQLVLTLF